MYLMKQNEGSEKFVHVNCNRFIVAYRRILLIELSYEGKMERNFE